MRNWKTTHGVVVYQILSGRCNCYLVEYEKQFILIDTSRKRYWPELKKRLHEIMGCDYLSFTLILTHAHFDHVENAYDLKTEFNCPVFLHIKAAPYLEVGSNPDIEGTYIFSKFIALFRNIPGILKTIDYEPCEPTELIVSDMDITPLGIPGKIVCTPGHTKGSISIILDDEVAIVGDAMIGLIKKRIFPPFGQDGMGIVKSWKKLLDCRCVSYLPSHGKGRNYFDVLGEYNYYKEKFKI